MHALREMLRERKQQLEQQKAALMAEAYQQIGAFTGAIMEIDRLLEQISKDTQQGDHDDTTTIPDSV